jgi:hypothetical protein
MPGLVPGIQVLLPRAEDVDGQDKPGHDEFSCEITDAQNADGKINYRNPLAGAKPHPNRAQCPGRRDAQQGRDGRSKSVRRQCHPGSRLGQRTSITPNARAGIACAPKWMECRSLGHYGQSCLREQLYPRRLSAIPTANSVGLAKHIVLAQIHQVKVCRCRFRKRKSIRWGNSTPPETHSPGGRNGHRAFLAFRGLGAGYLRVVAERAPSLSG